MINNRQAGRRRGRGGQRQQGGSSNAGNGNRIDNRARGNANQLYEKYKTLARDSQMQGDRVNTEYYLQFADHYFRVLAETRSRFEEQNQPRRGREDSFEDEDEGFDEDGEAFDMNDQPRRLQVDAREDRGNRNNNSNGTPRDGNFRDGNANGRDQRDGRDRDGGGNRANGNGNAARAPDTEADPYAAEPAAAVPARILAPDVEPAAPRRGRPRREPRVEQAVEGEAFDAALLPPSLGISVGDEAGDPVKPRRRRRPAAEATVAD